MKKYLAGIFCLTAMYIASTGCYNENKEDLFPIAAVCDTINVTYTKDIKPMMEQSCSFAGCHDKATTAGGFDLETFSKLKACAVSGLLVNVMVHADGLSPMPKNAPKMDDCSLGKVRKWVSDGAPEN